MNCGRVRDNGKGRGAYAAEKRCEPEISTAMIVKSRAVIVPAKMRLLINLTIIRNALINKMT